MDRIVEFFSDEGAQGLSEYGLILAFVFLAVIVSFTVLVNKIPTGIQPLAEELSK